MPSRIFLVKNAGVHTLVKSVSAARAALAAMAGSGPDGLAELTAEELADLPDFTPNIYKVVRALRKDDHGPYNCLASIVHDAAFVKTVVREYGLPTFANLRCGLWYAGRHHGGEEEGDASDRRGVEKDPVSEEQSEDAERFLGEEDVRVPIDGTCYFKSTDGHFNNWSFSSTRLNVHVAEAAARRGGCVIVDATRSTTKRFPDSLSKTIPIWAEMLNRAVREARRRDSGTRVDAAGFDDDSFADDFSAAFPPWVGDHERERIRELAPSFAERLRAVSPDLSRLVKTLRAPLRCFWVSRETAARGLPLLARGGGALAPGGEDAKSPACVPVVLVSASSPMQWHGERRVGSDGRSFAYVPGAGDDEESWARGLEADVFWRARRKIIGSGPSGCVERIDDVVAAAARGAAAAKRATVEPSEGERDAHERRRAAPGDAENDAQNDARRAPLPAGWRLAGSSDARRAAGGCLSGAARAAAAVALGATLGAVEEGAVRVLFADDDCRDEDDCLDEDVLSRRSLRGIALGSVKALARPETWSRARAVLVVGDAELPAFVAEGVSSGTPPYDAPFLRLPARLAKSARAELAGALPRALAFLETHATLVGATRASSRDYVLVACNDGTDHCVGVAVARAVAAELSPCETGTFSRREAPPVTKDSVRRRLAAVAAKHPEASPTRGTLKQVYNYLLDVSKGGR